MYNTFFAAQSEDGCLQKYFVPFNEVGKWFAHDTYCCPNNFKRMVFELPQAIFFKAEDGIVVNLYNAAELDDELASIRMTGNYPESEEVELQVLPKTKSPFALYFRIPRWCKDAKLLIENESFTGETGSLLKIHRRWNPCTVRIVLPMAIRFIRGNVAQDGKAAVLRGPVVYGWKRIPGIHPAALAKFEPEQGLRYENGKIFVNVSYRCCGVQKKTMELLPFCSPERERVYFRAPDQTEPDELFQYQKE